MTGAIRIAVSNHKGGVGKTTTSAHVGAALAQENYDVLLVDTDPQGTLSTHFTLNLDSLKRFVSLGVLDDVDTTNFMFPVDRPDGPDYLIDLEKRLPSIYEAFYNRKFVDNLAIRLISGNQTEYENYAEMRGFDPLPLDEGVIATTTDGPDIVPANRQMKGLEQMLAGENDGVFRIKQMLDEVQDQYDYIIIDTPASIGTLKDGSLVAAKNVLLPMQAETTSVSATRQHLEDIEEMEREDSFNLDMNVVGIVPNEVRDDGEAKNVTSVIRKKIPSGYWNHPERSKPDGFDENELPEMFWRADIYDNNGNLRDGIPTELASFWNDMGCQPLITKKRDYTDKVVPFDIRTRVAIRRAYSANRTLFTHNEQCDMEQNFKKIAQLIDSRTPGSD